MTKITTAHITAKMAAKRAALLTEQQAEREDFAKLAQREIAKMLEAAKNAETYIRMAGAAQRKCIADMAAAHIGDDMGEESKADACFAAENLLLAFRRQHQKGD